MVRKVTAQTFEDAIACHEARLTELGDRVRKERIIPLCDKNGWSFVSGMGTWVFFNGKVTVMDNHGDNMPDELRELWEFLNYEVMFRNSCVADWIEPYNYND
jgi:hypothetical protein